MVRANGSHAHAARTCVPVGTVSVQTAKKPLPACSKGPSIVVAIAVSNHKKTYQHVEGRGNHGKFSWTLGVAGCDE